MSGIMHFRPEIEPKELNLNRPSLLPEPEDASGLILSELPPDPPYVVEGVFHQGEKMVLGGASKAGKTWSLIDLALSVASGSPWWGFKTNACKVLYVNFEIQPEFFRRRVAIIKNRRGIELEQGALQMLHLRGIKMEPSAFCAAVVTRYQREREGLGLIVLDPIYKLMVGKDENSTGTLSSVADIIDQISKDCGSAVVYGHHFSKGNQSGKDSLDRLNGSGVAARDPDAVLTLTKHQEDDCSVLEAKLRNSPPIESKVLRWEFPLLIEDKNLDPADLKKVGGRPEIVTEEELLELVPKPTSHKDWFAAAESLGCSKTRFNEKLKSLSQKGKVIQTPGSKLWVKNSVPKPRD